MNPPANANGTEPTISRPASRRLGEPRRQWTVAPTDLLMLAATRSLATATVGLTPRKISAGVISAPPPMPVRPTTMPTPKLTSRTASALVVKRSGTKARLDGGLVGARSEVALGAQDVEHVRQRLLDGPAGGVDAYGGVRGLLVGRGDPGELGDLAAPGLGVEALPVAALALLQRGGDVDQHEGAA